jgi:hypothetical protein
MDDKKPLKISVRPTNRTLAPDFAKHASPVLSADDRFQTSVTDQGLLISCLWYRDLNAAFDLLDRHGFEKLLWGDPSIAFKFETVVVSGRTREIVLEPILLVEVESPPEFIGNVIGDLSSRRALITGQRVLEGGAIVVSAEAPLSELRRYDEDLANITVKSGSASASFLKYDRRWGFPGPPPDEPMSAALRA